MIELPYEPVVRVVAHGAVEPETLSVDVVRTVAVDTFAGRLSEAGFSMASLARDRSVESEERKHRQIVIEPHGFGPAAFTVTVLAALTELASVNVVAPMAAIARRLGSRRFYRSAMAGGASELSVCAIECEARIERMLEADAWPVRRRMARVAGGTVVTRMHVIGTVARAASGVGCLIETLLGMAGRAG